MVLVVSGVKYIDITIMYIRLEILIFPTFSPGLSGGGTAKQCKGEVEEDPSNQHCLDSEIFNCLYSTGFKAEYRSLIMITITN